MHLPLRYILGLFLIIYCIPIIGLPFAFLGNLTQTSAGLIIGLGILAGVLSIRSLPKDTVNPYPWDWFVIALWLWCSFRAFLWLVWESPQAIMVLSPNNLGDMALHLGLINYLSNTSFWPEGLIFSGPLQYPIGADFFNSILTKFGIDTYIGLRWTGLVLSLILLTCLFIWGKGFAVLAFIAGGGFTAIILFSGEKLDIFWKNPFLSMLVTQRGLLWALPAGVLLLCQWRARAANNGDIIPLWCEILLFATLPFFSVHSFVALSIIALGFGLQSLSEIPHWLTVAAIALIPASLLMWFVSGGFGSAGTVTLKPGWFISTTDLWYWTINFGIVPLLFGWTWLYTLWIRRKEADSFVQPAAFAGLLLFLVSMVFSFAKWDWDNTKILIWVWIVMLPPIWAACFKPATLFIRCLLIIALCTSGIVELYMGLDRRHGYQLVKKAEMVNAQMVLKEVFGRPRILAAPDYNQPAILLGYPVIVGYDGHLWSHGFNYHNTFRQAEQVLKQEGNWQQVARQLGAEYVLWGPKEQAKYNRNWEGTPIAESDNTKLFKLKSR